MSHKMAALKFFLRNYTKVLFLMAHIVEGEGKFMATEIPGKIMKNTSYFILTN